MLNAVRRRPDSWACANWLWFRLLHSVIDPADALKNRRFSTCCAEAQGYAKMARFPGCFMNKLRQPYRMGV